ncbi:hypothetical protein D0Z07_2138 [Hyphodiscus hymeniophilus]|uniref:Stress-response A/B barrel domain-containing protein n=1 Tax=Hyphodiscus hymeniophilus TaxID=353542 RepID=A0A9P6VPH9_9HELO|nr:hypothetical protein D0Z07_2138 [Hyphodiscus hymeniophilus]
MPIVHILFLKFKRTQYPETVQKLSKQIVDLKDTCVHLQTHKPYITTGKGGVNNIPKAHAFKDEADRAYFLDKDLSHQDFIAAISKESDDYLVLDSTPGFF